jgi:hypothetical protein
MAAPINPRAAPTQIKTVPSGRLDFCMKDALERSGTMTVGIPAPGMVGSPVKWKTDRLVEEMAGPLVTSKVSRDAVEDADDVADDAADDAAVVFAAAEPVVFAVSVLPVLDALSDDDVPLPLGAVTVLRSGKPESAAWAAVARSRMRRMEKTAVKHPKAGPWESLIAKKKV